MALMESATQATRESQENQAHQEILVNGVAQDFPGFVTSLCAIRPTISGNITAKDRTSDDMSEREADSFKTHPADSFKTEMSAAKADVTSLAEINRNGQGIDS